VIRGPPDCPPNRCDSQQDSRHATLEDASNAPLKNINQKKKKIGTKKSTSQTPKTNCTVVIPRKIKIAALKMVHMLMLH